VQRRATCQSLVLKIGQETERESRVGQVLDVKSSEPSEPPDSVESGSWPHILHLNASPQSVQTEWMVQDSSEEARPTVGSDATSAVVPAVS
jgi:hypothetical protein